jgi:hypothetical protein
MIEDPKGEREGVWIERERERGWWRREGKETQRQ